MIERSAGLLLHVTSLPGGRLGPEAYRFVDFLEAAGQRWWQVLPLGPRGAGGSPYAASSAFAGDEDLCAPEDWGLDGYRAWRHRQRFWLEDYALFRALEAAHGGASWVRWETGLRDRRPSALDDAREAHAGEIEHHCRAQYAFERQWLALKRYANERGVGLLGDLPLFVAHDSADVWAGRALFKLARNGQPTVLAGVPPDCFSATGQRWGSPHYRWPAHRREGWRWWSRRAKRMARLFDAVRLDHFLGLVRAWEIPVRARTAKRGKWARGPGAELLRPLKRALGARPMIAEDLGLKTPAADDLRRRFGLAGMHVLQFAFGGDPDDLPHAFDRDSVVYTGTHDNDTLRGWFRAGGPDRDRARRYAGCRRDAIHWGLIRVAHLSPAALAIVPVQDLLGLGSRARMNTPGTTRGNWSWRLEPGALHGRLARRLRELTGVAGR